MIWALSSWYDGAPGYQMSDHTPARVSTTLNDSHCHVTPAAPRMNQRAQRRDSAHSMGTVQLVQQCTQDGKPATPLISTTLRQ
ncbi:hypothetical protein K443DRAFT_13858 [Laccaria amethystina LaAM-08-1]|uniref:Uncharacterized protein n=1 Tax=Laccaria amethystina LaAM-08-1 TaxID=1095629 RepID=A0A0C9X6R0_9AGAR|nr:hypothetical protein K443DRAFT_13858 [Laccaria amethystina LaAM-08-1]